MNLPRAVSTAAVVAALAVHLAAQSGAMRPVSRGSGAATLAAAPSPVREAWLRFHQSNLCRELDAVFVFNAKGVEVWCRVTDEGNLKQLELILEPLRRTLPVAVYATRADREKKPFKPEDEDPIPSLSNNAELSQYMRDPFSRSLGTAYDDPAALYAGNASAEQKRRLKLYGDQILEWARNIDRIANDLPSLAAMAFHPDSPGDTRGRARSICLDHARSVSKDAGRLIEDLSHALPRGSTDVPPAGRSSKERENAITPYDGALRVSELAHAAVARVRRFLFPQAHTVNLADLRQSSMIGVLKELQRAVSDFESRAR